RRAGVALAACAAAQLVVDAAALVPLGADDKQPAGLAHGLGLALHLGGKLGAQRVKAGAGLQNAGVVGVGVAVALGQQHFQPRVDALLRRGGQLAAGGLGAGLGVLILVLALVQVGGQRL